MSDVRAVASPTADDLERARVIVSAHLAPTPLIRAGRSSNLFLKLESLQPTGSFKVRGALAAISAAPPGIPVITASAGNHALGIAQAATLLGREGIVVTAQNASPAKVSAIRRFDVEHLQVGSSFDDAETYALGRSRQGATYISAYNDTHVIAGQGTIGTELEEQMADPFTVVCGVGGGGLASGLGLWAHGHPGIEVVGVETEVSTAVSAAVRAGRQVDVPVGESIADGMAGNIEPGSVSVDIVKRYVRELITVSEVEIREAIRYLALECGVVAEGAGAAATAAVLAGKIPGRTVAVVSGRNITGSLLDEVLHG